MTREQAARKLFAQASAERPWPWQRKFAAFVCAVIVVGAFAAPGRPTPKAEAMARPPGGGIYQNIIPLPPGAPAVSPPTFRSAADFTDEVCQALRDANANAYLSAEPCWSHRRRNPWGVPALNGSRQQ